MKRFLCLTIFSVLLITYSCKQADKDRDDSETAEVQTELKKPEPVIKYGFDLEDFELVHDTIRSGDSFGNILSSNGFSLQEVHTINENVKDTFDSRKLVVGKPYILIKSKADTDKPIAFIYQKDIINYTVINMEDSISVETHKRPVSLKRRTLSGAIHSSLSVTMDKAGASPSLIHELASLYQWKIDFFRIQKGDQFRLIYNERYVDDSIYAGVESIEAAKFIHYGEPYYAFHFDRKTEDGFSSYYDDEANSLQNFFLKAPVEYTRISSRYTPKRFHPVQKRWKAHLGTDYAAPTGTPIHSTADGVITVSGYNQYNGNYVKVKHNSKYTTQYLHMSKRKARVGQRVKQGEVIGYVGQTGLATGPHVCYRFWVNGKQEDPYRQKMPNSEPLAENLKSQYFETINPLKEELDSMVVEEEETNKTDRSLAGLSTY